MACMDADVDYDDVRCPRRVVVANLASEWYDVRVLSFVWIRRGRFSCEKSTEETRTWVAFAVLVLAILVSCYYEGRCWRYVVRP